MLSAPTASIGTSRISYEPRGIQLARDTTYVRERERERERERRVSKYHVRTAPNEYQLLEFVYFEYLSHFNSFSLLYHYTSSFIVFVRTTPCSLSERRTSVVLLYY